MVVKKDLILRCREILYKGKIEEEDKIFLKELLENHPFYEMKKGVGIKDFFVEKTIYGTTGFNIIRIDGSTTDFSFMECISPKNNIRKIKCACRTSIRPTIEKIKTDNNKIIHHELISFDEIVNNWLIENKKIDLTLNPNKDNNHEIYFISEDTKNSFIDFHNKIATLIEITRQEHKLKHKGESQ